MQSARATRPTDLGLVEGHLRPCPNKPNCVSTQAGDDEHKIDPIAFSGTTQQAIERLESVVTNMPRTKIVTSQGNYMHVEFTTLIMRFVDDVEFAIDGENKTIHFRSASRVGHSDLGVNRRRMEAIRSAFKD
ncbi:MAG: DUF1499 domain-containing protein [Planctomycetia bacterium]|nr:DUF1499 domain-containing protein [Planctomycetia bacterium]